MPHKMCNDIFLHPEKKGISYHLFYNIIIVQVRYITIETKETSCIGYYEFLFPPSYSEEDFGAKIILLIWTVLNHAFNGSCSRLGSFGFIYINGSYI